MITDDSLTDQGKDKQEEPTHDLTLGLAGFRV